MVKLSILGPAELRDSKGVLEQSFLTGPKRLALLAYLALNHPQSYKRRDILLPLFWPNQGQSNARNALSNMLYHMRQSLGDKIVVNRGKEEIRLANFWCDVHAFNNAIDVKKPTEAINYYRGTLLEGLHVAGTSSEFQQWLDRERQKLKQNYWSLLKSLANSAEKENNIRQAVNWWRKLHNEDPYDSNSVRKLIETMVSISMKKEAINIAKEHTTLLEDEFGDKTAQEFLSLANKIIDKHSYSANQHSSVNIQELDPYAIAVLPFENLNQDDHNTSFATGIHNDLLSGLSKISAISIIARGSVLRYKDDKIPVQDIARKLKVGTIVEGSVQNTTERIRLHIQLTDARSDQLLWADTYERRLTATNLFDIQSELSQKIVATLKSKLTSKEIERIAEKPTENLEAYHLYAQGRTHLSLRTENNIHRAISYFMKAIGKDSNYALAWAGLAEALLLVEFYEYAQPKELPKVEEAARKAIDLDPMLGEAHTSMGIFHANNKNGSLAIRELQKSIELQPSSAEGHSWLGWIYLTLGNLNKALEPAERAAKLDPMAPYARVYLGKLYIARGQYEKALNESRSARQLQPDFAITHLMEGLSLYHLRRYAEAQLALEEALSLVDPIGVPHKSEILAALALAYLARNNTTKANKIFNSIKSTKDIFAKGLVVAGFGKIGEALDIFESITDWGYFSTTYFRYFFPDVLDPVRRESRYREILKQVDTCWGLEQ